MLGEKLKKLRETNGLVQRQVAAELEVDTAYISKVESNEKRVSRNHLKKLAMLFNISDKELLTLWLADRVYNIVKDEDVALRAIHFVEMNIKNTKSKG
jgi:transcriptional regulator with XRE-family HTH domain